MAKPRNCIMCALRAKSSEHTFPAALGGRRTNRGIYCEKHNNSFGGLVARLEAELSMLNAALKIRPDRKDAAKPFIYTQDETLYSLIGDTIEVYLPPPFDPSKVSEDGHYQLQAPSLEVAKRWIESNSSEEWIFRIDQSGTSETHYQIEPHHIRLRLGGPDLLQAIVYLAMTFFAHSFPTEARQAGINPIKALLLEDLENDKERLPEEVVWWDGRNTQDVVGESPFLFGHAVLVGISDKTSHAYAYISFFSCFSFGVDLGPVTPELEFRSVRSFIDPTAENARDSVSEVKSQECAEVLGERGISLHDMIDSGSASRQVGALMGKVAQHQQRLAAAEILKKVRAINVRDVFELVSRCREVAYEQRQKVYNLLRAAVSNASSAFPESSMEARALYGLIAPDPSMSEGLSHISSRVMELAIHLYAGQLAELKIDQKLSLCAIVDLFYGEVGYELAREKIVQVLMSQKPKI
ncbi:hypothetical protein [Pseudomonas fluorescens]|uniref:hypothetical protein n=1 Tax=Pseudomonas shahriarae TaxID=2745512 RepID=UPI0012FD30C6